MLTETRLDLHELGDLLAPDFTGVNFMHKVGGKCTTHTGGVALVYRNSIAHALVKVSHIGYSNLHAVFDGGLLGIGHRKLHVFGAYMTHAKSEYDKKGADCMGLHVSAHGRSPVRAGITTYWRSQC